MRERTRIIDGNWGAIRHVAGDNCVMRASRGVAQMGLKAPGILTFMVAVILTVAVLIMKFFGAQIPFLMGNEFWALLLAQVILILGCIMRGL
jgi:hypothetical protein